jgi:hypothetical protein
MQERIKEAIEAEKRKKEEQEATARGSIGRFSCETTISNYPKGHIPKTKVWPQQIRPCDGAAREESELRWKPRKDNKWKTRCR